jgi:hypothetical protein
MKDILFILIFVPFLSFGQLEGTNWTTKRPVTVESLTKGSTPVETVNGITVYQGTKKVKGVPTTYFFIIIKDEKTGILKRKTVYRKQ